MYYIFLICAMYLLLYYIFLICAMYLLLILIITTHSLYGVFSIRSLLSTVCSHIHLFTSEDVHVGICYNSNLYGEAR